MFTGTQNHIIIAESENTSSSPRLFISDSWSRLSRHRLQLLPQLHKPELLLYQAAGQTFGLALAGDSEQIVNHLPMLLIIECLEFLTLDLLQCLAGRLPTTDPALHLLAFVRRHH